MVEFESVVGVLGSITAASLFFPQVYVSYRSRQTRDLSWFGIVVGMLNGVFWTTYGFLNADPFIYVTNAILFVGASMLMLLKGKYR